MGTRSRGIAALALLLVAVVAGACTSSSDDATPASTTTAPTTTTSIAEPEVPTFEVVDEHEVDGNWRQGLARVEGGWIFATNASIYRTDDAFEQVDEHLDAIPPELTAQGYDHLGDPDVHDGLIWVPVERPDKDEARQATIRFDAETLEVVDWVEVAQHHNAFIGVDDDGVAWSTDEFDDDALVRYRIVDGEVEPLEPLQLSRTVERIQGGDLAGGAMWLSTDDDVGGVYRVDLESGEVAQVGTTGRLDGEGEGIDAADGEPASLRVLLADVAIVPMWVLDLEPAAS